MSRSNSLPSQPLESQALPSVLTPLSPDIHATLVSVFESTIVFNQVLGLRVVMLSAQSVKASIQMRPELVGHPATQRIHGGVISASLDALGGLAVMAAMAARHPHDAIEQHLHRIGKVSTIDLRIDYLRPGIGEAFELQAEVMRLGSRVASTRMMFMRSDGKLMSTGAGAYIVS